MRTPAPQKHQSSPRKLAHRRPGENACSHTVSPNSPVNGPLVPTSHGKWRWEGQWPLPEAHSGDGGTRTRPAGLRPSPWLLEQPPGEFSQPELKRKGLPADHKAAGWPSPYPEGRPWAQQWTPSPRCIRPKKSTLLREIDSTFIYHGKESCFSLLKALEGKGEDSSGSESHVVWVLVLQSRALAELSASQ